MLELSLHVLDLLENAVTAGAQTIAVSVQSDERADRLEIAVEDDGPGLPVTYEQALDPFFTTKQGKRTGLGLSLFRATAEQAGGGLTLGASPLGGLAVTARFQLSHVDLPPLGDLAGTFSAMIVSHPECEWICRLTDDGREQLVRLSQIRAELPFDRRDELRAALRFSQVIKTALSAFDRLPDKASFLNGGM